MADSNTRIGRGLLWVTSAAADGETAAQIASTDSGATWISNSNRFYPPNSWMGIALNGKLVPEAYKTGKFSVGLEPTLEPASKLPLSKEIVLDGSVTFEMVYL